MKKKQQPSDSAKNPNENAEAANAAMRSQEKAAKSSTSPNASPNASQQSDSRVDEAGEESFPASDPPAYSAGTATPTRED